jgi:hypothetical protein
VSVELGIQIVTSRNIDLRFDEFPVQAHQALLEVITSSTERLAEMVRSRVPKKTGRLESEINSRVHSFDNRITGIVEVAGKSENDFRKAAALEYGAHGTMRVREHTERLSHLFGAPMEQIEVTVKAHARKLNIKAHDFLGGSAADMAGEVMQQMREAVAKATQE